MPAKVVPWPVVRRRMVIVAILSVIAIAVSLARVSIPLAALITIAVLAGVCSAASYIEIPFARQAIMGGLAGAAVSLPHEFYPRPIQHTWFVILQVVGLAMLLIVIAAITFGKPHRDRRLASAKDRVA